MKSYRGEPSNERADDLAGRRRRWWWSLLTKNEGDPLNTQHRRRAGVASLDTFTCTRRDS